jgi:hypothetical protein
MTAAEETQKEEKKSVSSSDSKTKVHFSKRASYKYLSGKREPISIRIDTGLYSAFKPLSKRVYGSTCKAVEIYMIALIEAVENGVHFSDAEKAINIEKIVIERNLRERRCLEIETDETERVLVSCDVARCRNAAVGKAVWIQKDKEYAVCSRHLAEARSNPKLWKEIQR